LNNADREYGSRSGIQKGIRRGDLDLVHTCFETLWATPTHRNWLKWRATTLATEEAWQMIGEYGKLLKSGTDSKEEWRKYIYRLCLATKSKDAVALWFSAHDGAPYPEGHPEFMELDLWRNMCGGKDEDYLGLANDMYNTYVTSRKMSEYEKNAMDALLRRTKMGGMMGDRFICLSSMMLLYLRGLDEDEVLGNLKVNAAEWKERSGRSKPETVDLPWYAFDFHTQAGKIACNIFMKHSASKYNISRGTFMSLWFFLESAKMPRYLLKIPKNYEEELTAFDSAWWVPYVSYMVGADKGRNAKESVELWKNSIRDDIKGAVNWILEKREDD
jgi:hypothetical protein